MKKTLFLCLLIISIVGNIFLFSQLQHSLAAYPLSDLVKQYPLLSHRTLVSGQNELINNFFPLRQELDAMIEPYKDNFALYFEYLPTGTTMGINEDSEFTAASLLKVPVVMAYYHKKERFGITEDPDVVIQENQLNDVYGDLYKQGAGTKINIADAIKLSLQKSDNTANLVIAGQMTQEDFSYVYEGLDIPMMTVGNSPVITAQQYASILKSLHFASVLTKEDSQEILDLLTKTQFHSMLPAGVPKNVIVAHKIGLIDEQIYQDCGIVYVPGRPYVLCMISKSDHDTAAKRMSAISKKVYDYVSTAKGEKNNF